MSGHVHWLLELSINDGHLEAFKALMGEMIAGTKGKAGTINYEWFLSDDEATCHIYERYVDSAATMVHLGNFGVKYAARFLTCLTPTRCTVYGNPDDAMRAALNKLGVTYMDAVGGFARYG